MAAPFDIVAIDHIVLRAADPAALERFYLNVLGLTLEARQGKLAQLRAGSGLIDIVPADEPGPARGTSSTGGANLDHLCLRVEPFDAAAIAKHLAGQGVACGPATLRNGGFPRLGAGGRDLSSPLAAESSGPAKPSCGSCYAIAATRLRYPRTLINAHVSIA